MSEKPKSMSSLMGSSSNARIGRSKSGPQSKSSSRTNVPPSRRHHAGSSLSSLPEYPNSPEGASVQTSSSRRTSSGDRQRNRSSSERSERTISSVDGPENSRSREKSNRRRSMETAGNSDSLSKARERLQSRGKAAPSPRTPRKNMSDADVDDLRRSLDADGSPNRSPGSNKPSSSRRMPTRGCRRSRSTDSMEPFMAVLAEEPTTPTSTAPRPSSQRGRSSADSTSNDQNNGKGSSRRKSRSRSRSRSKSAKKRPSRKLPLPPSKEEKESSPVDDATKEKEKEKETKGVVTSSSVKVRRKPVVKSSLAALSMLDDMNPRLRRSRDARSVGTHMLSSPPNRSKPSAIPDRPILKPLSEEKNDSGPLADFLKAGQSTAKKSSSRSVCINSSGISSLSTFLKVGEVYSSKKSKSSSRSVFSVPVSKNNVSLPENGSSGKEMKKHVRRRLKKGSKSDDEEELHPKDQKINRGHRSLGSGLDLHSASDDILVDKTPAKKGKKPNKAHRSYGSGLDMQTASDEVTEEPSVHVSDILEGMISDSDEEPEENDGVGLVKSLADIPNFSAKDLGSIVAMRRERMRLQIAKAKEDVDDNLEDIFSFYSWSTARQARNKVHYERKMLIDSLRQGAFLDIYNYFVRRQRVGDDELLAY